MTYDGFISYSHAADGKLAPALQHALHRVAKPLFQLRALHVFIDKESLFANPALWPAIEKALSDSKHFLLLAAPESARSLWVIREVEWWITNRPIDKLLIVLTDGELVSNTNNADFDWDKTNALPAIISHRYTDEPLWVDLRWAKSTNGLSLRHSRFRAAVLDLAAPMRGKPKEELDSEDVRQYRKTRLLARLAVTVLFFLMLIAAVFGVVARFQRNEAVRQRDLALSRQIGSQSLRLIDSNLDTALLLAVEASRTADTFDAKNALLSALVRSPSLSCFLHGHHAGVTSATFSPDGKMVASGSSDDGVVIFWDLAQGRAIGTPVVAHKKGVTSMIFSEDGQLFASAGADGTVRLWNTTNHRFLGNALSGHTNSVTALTFSPDSRTLASADSSGIILLWNVDTREVAGLPLRDAHGDAVTALAINADCSAVASADGFGNVTLWNLRTPDRMATPFFEARFFVRHLAFSTRGGLIASGFSRGNLIRWDVGSGPPRVHPILTPMGESISAVDERSADLSSQPTVVAAAIPGDGIIVADLATDDDREPLAVRTTLNDVSPSSGILTLGVSPDGRRMVSGYRDGTLVIWDTAEKHALATPFQGDHKQAVTAIAFAQKGTTLVSASFDNTFIFRNVATLEPLGPPLTGNADGVSSVALSPDGTLMVSGGYDGSLLLWEVANRHRVTPPLSGRQNQRINDLAFSNDGTLVASAGGDNGLMLWDIKTRKPLDPPLRGDGKRTISVALSPDGRTLVSGDIDGGLRLWDIPSRKPLGSALFNHREKPVTALAFSRDGQLLASVGGIRLNLWRITKSRTLEAPVTLDPIARERRQSLGGGVVFSRDGKMVATGGNGRIVLWDIASRQPLEPVFLGWGQVETTRIALAPDGAVLAASNGNGIVLWDIALDSWQRQACRIANRDLTEEEWIKFIGPEIPYRRTCSDTQP
jgi:WD40 repeat protein